jgi:hypothetical protein
VLKDLANKIKQPNNKVVFLILLSGFTKKISSTNYL